MFRRREAIQDYGNAAVFHGALEAHSELLHDPYAGCICRLGNGYNAPQAYASEGVL